MEYESMDARGRSGDLISAWDPGVFSKQRVFKHESFLIVSGMVAGTNMYINIVNVYAPCDVMRRSNLWGELKEVVDSSNNGLWIMVGDFNEVKEEEERMKSRFNSQGAMIFNNFIAETGLIEYQVGGQKYTYMSKDGSNLSKIDHVLVCDFGLVPFRFYNSWLEDGGIDVVVNKVMENHVRGDNVMKDMACILKNLKIQVIEWRKESKAREEEGVYNATKEVEQIEKLVESRSLTATEKEKRVS
ncbi:uncharacterized protein LOC110932445 [Helianthus annuus]|uniref:uncharacterized protein LOC110932445 n=1 Tax=Helianthus annuus TaxID=4232 RepID=UPI000B907F53|nr:uncharacterized protein LOC110932445 [Helianthus annuus]